MTKRFQTHFLGISGVLALLFLSACTTESTDARYEFVGELSTSHTMSGGSKLRLRMGEDAYELVLNRETEFIDIRMMTIGADWLIGGKYGVNGELDGARLLVDQIAYLGGGEPSQSMLAPPISAGAAGRMAPNEPPLFQVDRNATGPLTMDELQINIPADLAAKLSDEKQACWLREIENMVAEAGDPATLEPGANDYLSRIDPDDWNSLSPHMKRALVAQAITSRAITRC